MKRPGGERFLGLSNVTSCFRAALQRRRGERGDKTQPDNIRAMQPIDTLTRFEWRPTGYVTEMPGTQLDLRGFCLTFQLDAENHQSVGAIVIPRQLTAEEAALPDSKYRTYLVVDP